MLNQVEVLLVEDNMHDAEMTIRSLKKVNLANNLIHVKDGEEALDFIFAQGKQGFDLRFAHFAEMLQGRHLTRRRVVQYQNHILAVGPLPDFPFKNLGQMCGRDVLNRIVFIDHDRHVVCKAWSQRQHRPRTQTKNVPRLHRT